MKQKRARALVKKGTPIRQIAALVHRRTAEGSLQILLVSSRQTKRIVIPRGWPMRKVEDWRAAEIEAREEAGVIGQAEHQPIGSYRYWKRMRTAFVPIVVHVFPLTVSAELPRWKEDDERQRAWLDWRDARALIDESELVTLIDSFEETARGLMARSGSEGRLTP
ncbi:MAG: NUDIX hydrolase [Rhizobiaceae bacterium]